MRISDWSSDVCSSDLLGELSPVGRRGIGPRTIACYVMRIFERERAGEKGAHLSPSCPVATFVERDTGDPCAEGAFAIIAIERRKAGDERLLRQIHRPVGLPDLLYAEPVARSAEPRVGKEGG